MVRGLRLSLSKCSAWWPTEPLLETSSRKYTTSAVKLRLHKKGHTERKQKGNTGYSISRNPSALYRGSEYPRRKASARYSQRRCGIRSAPGYVSTSTSSDVDVRNAIKHFTIGSPAGGSGLRPNHLYEFSKVEDCSHGKFIGALTNFVNHPLSGEVPK